jgi:protein-tyrosine phosphatase
VIASHCPGPRSPAETTAELIKHERIDSTQRVHEPPTYGIEAIWRFGSITRFLTMNKHMLTRRRAITAGAGVIAALAFPTALLARSVSFEAASCERLPDGRLRVRWTTSPSGQPVDVAVANDPRASGGVVLSKANSTGVFEARADSQTRRPYFQLSAAEAKLTVAERVLPLAGGRNFRDLGGYATDDNRRIRWGTLYRSGTMASLTDADYEYLNTLGIRVVCDFRTTDERTIAPDAWRGPRKPAYVAFDYEMDSQLLPVAHAPDVTAERMYDTMKELYGTMPYQLIENYRAMFLELAAGRTPLAFHCTAGKDRTGIATGLVLTALGIPRGTILEDYALSDRIVNYEATVIKDAAKPQQGPYDFIGRLPKEIRAPMLRSDPAYLDATFRALEKNEGSVLGFVRKRLGIEESAIAAIRETLLDRA